MMTYFGPSLWIFFSAAKTLSSLVNWCASLSLSTKPSSALEQLQQIRQRDVQPQVHRVGHDEFRAAHLVEHVVLERGRDVRQQDERRVLVRLRQRGREGLEHAQLGQQRAAVVHVHLVFARPMKGFAGQNLQAFEVNFVPAIKLEVFLGKILADHADQFDRAEKARGDGGVAGRAAQQARVFRLREF